MGAGRFTLVTGVLVEEVGEELMVLVPGSRQVIALSGEARDVIRSVEAGASVAWSESVAELVRLGVLARSHPVSRRGLITSAVGGAGVGIAALTMPSVAAAASDQAAEIVALTFVDRNLTFQDGARYVVRVAVRLPLGFVAPVPDPVPISARIGTDEVAANFISLTGASRAEWYDTSKPVHLVLWSISTALGNGSGWVDADREVVFSWGTTTYRPTGDVNDTIGFGPPG